MSQKGSPADKEGQRISEIVRNLTPEQIKNGAYNDRRWRHLKEAHLSSQQQQDNQES
jgi:hypothetical protein